MSSNEQVGRKLQFTTTKVGILGGLAVTALSLLLEHNRGVFGLSEVLWTDEMYAMNTILYVLIVAFVINTLVLAVTRLRTASNGESSEYQTVVVIAVIPCIVTTLVAAGIGIYAGFGAVPSSFGIGVIAGYIAVGVFISGLFVISGSVAGVVISTITFVGSLTALLFVNVTSYGYRRLRA